MDDEIKIISKLNFAIYRYVARWRRLKRIWFPSPAELRLIELMGGKAWRIKWLTNHNGFPFAIVLSMGRLLRDEHFKREVRVGPFYLDFGNDVFRAVEVDGHHWHLDVVADYDRDVYLYGRGWRVLRIQAGDLWRQPNLVQRRVLNFVYY